VKITTNTGTSFLCENDNEVEWLLKLPELASATGSILR